jgi:bifunctional UDP-N-acetylglucosamine pyrophosphorylase/glucosamine-1-phosphate N-acetyltransferase
LPCLRELRGSYEPLKPLLARLKRGGGLKYLDHAKSLLYLYKMKKIGAILLAGGKGTRMKSRVPKVLHRLCGKPMLYYPLDVLRSLKVSPVVCVIGHGAEEIKEAFPDVKASGVSFALQAPQLGTGHAVMSALKIYKGAGKGHGLHSFRGDILILSGDVPLITKETVSALVKLKKKTRSAISFVSAIIDEPGGYGRVIRDVNKRVIKVVEAKDATLAQRRITEVNCGLYLVDSEYLRANIKKLGKNNVQGEYYLPDLVKMATTEGLGVNALTLFDPAELMGINNRVELAEATSYMRRRIMDDHMLSGVTIVDPEATYIDYGVKIGSDSTIHPGVHILGESVVGTGTTILPNTIIESSKIGRGARIGPSARLRPGTIIKDDVAIGNFVEVKNSLVGKGTKAGHLSYIGDSKIGANVNIGAGTITCNYDGFGKYITTIRDNAFIGSDTQLIAPVVIGKGAYIASGSTITSDVPAGSLAMSRTGQKTLKGWVEKKARKNNVSKANKKTKPSKTRKKSKK